MKWRTRARAHTERRTQRERGERGQGSGKEELVKVDLFNIYFLIFFKRNINVFSFAFGCRVKSPTPPKKIEKRLVLLDSRFSEAPSNTFFGNYMA